MDDRRTDTEADPLARTRTGHGGPVDRWTITPEPTALRRVRDLVATVCRRRGLPDDLVDSIVSAVDELAANARRYGDFEVRAYEHPPGFAVADACPDGAEVVEAYLRGRAPEIDDEHGRGLMIVAALFPEATVAPTVLASGAPGKEIRLTVAGEAAIGDGAGKGDVDGAGTAREAGGPSTSDRADSPDPEVENAEAGEVGRVLGGRG